MWGWLFGRIDFSVLGFGEGTGIEIEKREERQSVGLLFFALMFFYIFVLENLLLLLFFNTVLMWKIVRVSETSVLYI